MKWQRWWLAVALLAVSVVSGCTIQLVAFRVPTQVRAGSMFEVVVTGFVGGGSPGIGRVGCALQIPNQFQAVASWFTKQSNATWGPGDAAFNSLFTVEPGNFLVTLRGSNTHVKAGALGEMSFKVLLQAPAVPATFQFKVIMYADQGNDPAGVTQFVAVTAAPHAKTIQVLPSVATDFELQYPTAFSALNSPVEGCFVDVDRDGRDDFVTISSSGLGCWLSRPSGWLASSASLGASPLDFGTGDFDGDGFVDIATTTGTIFYGDGVGHWTPVANASPTAWQRLVVGDVNGDGRDDVLLSTFDGSLCMFHGNADRTFTPANNGLPQASTGSLGSDLVLADLTGDGNLDVYSARTPGDNLWMGDGHGNWVVGTGVPAIGRSGAAVDIDGDGAAELILTRNDNDRSAGPAGIEVYRYQGGGVWAQASGTGLGNTGTWYSGAVGIDFDRDGDTDVIVTPTGTALELYENNGAGHFTRLAFTGLSEQLIAPANRPGMRTRLSVGDWNGDTYPDLAVPVWTRLLLDAPYAENLLLYSNNHTGVAAFGTSCRAGPLATVTANGSPQRGNAAFAMSVHGPVANSPGWFWFGDSRVAWNATPLPLDLAPFGAPGCTLWAAPDVSLALLLDGAGNATLPLPVPNVPELALRTFFAQALSAAPGSNAMGQVFSAGAAIRVQ